MNIEKYLPYTCKFYSKYLSVFSLKKKKNKHKLIKAIFIINKLILLIMFECVMLDNWSPKYK